MPKVFITAALMPMGGGYMAYHVGRILHRHFGYEMVNIQTSENEKSIFHYDTPMSSVTLQQLEQSMTPEDLLVVNPSFSQLLLGLRFPGRKIMYVQDFKTFQVLDCHCDLYVSVSGLVNRFLYAVYGLTTPVIPAFVQAEDAPKITPWDKRPPGSALVYLKHPDNEHRITLNYLTWVVKQKAPEIDLSNVVEGRGMSHKEFLRAIGSVRYLVNLSLAEGFGLVSLEAMMMGTTVTGVDGLAGMEYMRNGQNCLVGSARNLRMLPDMVMRAFSDTQLAERCAQGGRRTAAMFGYHPFKAAWLTQLTELLQVAPSNV